MALKPAKRGIMAQVLSRMAATETLISDRHAEGMLIGLLGDAEQVADPAAAWDNVRGELCASWDIEDGPAESRKPFIYRDGVAVIPVHGILVNRFNYCWGSITGYDFIRRQKNLALADPDVRLIAYDHDTPGGEAAGCDELAREIYADRGIKPSIAIVNTLSASGGYWLAAPCTKVVCAPSGSVGSIGVYIQHMMIARLLADWGVDVEFVKRGEYKTSGNAFEPLGKKDRQYLQSMVDERYDEFVAAVAEFRGIEESIARDTEARVMRPTEALSLGLIDAALSPAQAIADFVAELGRDEPNEDFQEDTMADAPTITAEQRAEIAKEVQARISGIVSSEEAKGREGLANHFAFHTDMSVEGAKAALAAAPKAEEPKKDDGEKKDPPPESGNKDGLTEKKDDDDTDPDSKGDADKGGNDGEQGKGKSKFEQAMDQGKHPEVGPDGKQGGEDGEDKVARILGAQAMATGRRYDNGQQQGAR